MAEADFVDEGVTEGLVVAVLVFVGDGVDVRVVVLDSEGEDVTEGVALVVMDSEGVAEIVCVEVVDPLGVTELVFDIVGVGVAVHCVDVACNS